MPVEFALRPRIRLREAPPAPRRTRVRIPRFALPVAAYWLAMGGITYLFVHGHDAPRAPNDESALAAEPSARESRPWWRFIPDAPHAGTAAPALAAPALAPEPARTAESSPALAAEPAPMPEPAVAAEPAAVPEPTPFEPAPTAPRVLPKDPSASRSAIERRRADAAVLPRPTRTSDSAERARPAFSDSIGDETRAALPAPAPPPPRSDAQSGGLPSCEAAIANANQDMDFSQGNGTADLPTTAIAAVLENGAWLGSCDVPASTALDVCVAIRGGRVIGASVVSRPADARATACVRNRAAALQFPYSSHVDIARTRF